MQGPSYVPDLRVEPFPGLLTEFGVLGLLLGRTRGTQETANIPPCVNARKRSKPTLPLNIASSVNASSDTSRWRFHLMLPGLRVWAQVEHLGWDLGHKNLLCV